MNAIASEKMPETVSAGAAPSAVNSQKNNSIAPVPPDPVFVLAPRSFSSIVATMLTPRRSGNGFLVKHFSLTFNDDPCLEAQPL